MFYWLCIYSQEVRLAAIRALNNSLEFVKDNFEREVQQMSYLGATVFRILTAWL